jgi:hypothetical protein
MFLPISDAPNPKGVPYATWTLIALNVAVYLVVNLPLGVQPADANDPAFREYLEFLSQYVSSRAELAQAARAVSAYDLAEGFALAGLILLEDRHDPTAAYQYLAAALQLRPGAATAAEIRRALAVIESLQKRPLRPEFRR